MSLLDWWTQNEKVQLVLAGALGGIVRWATLRDHWTDGLISVIVGAICAVYISPLALPELIPFLGNVGVSSDSVGGLSGFLIGIGGVSVSGLIMDAWRARRKMLEKEATKGD